MKIINLINKADKTLFSFELLPPLKGQNIDSIYKTIDPLLDFNPFAINITYHQEEIVYNKLENGLLEAKAVRKRPGTVAISAAINNRYPDITVVPHLICGGFSKEDTEYALIDLHFLDIDNILVLRGDPPRNQRRFTPNKGGHRYASELVEQVMQMNKGIFLDGKEVANSATDFCVGVAGYPEKHYEAPNMEYDLQQLKKKLDAGAEYIVTQMFFDNSKYFAFVDKCRAAGINVPIIPGLKPIATKREINVLPQIFHVDIPDALVQTIQNCNDNEEAWQAGIDWSIKQSIELKEYGVPVLHYFTVGQSENIYEIAKAVFSK